ncbi:MAG: ATP-binding protein, partial [Treponemataceae bacterium]|nr:ATP-binding protein [Treponemataceae bacterium]
VYDIDKEVMGYYTVKVILQPFVENILEHAMYRRESPITIIISAKPVGGDILFKIIDDGVGVRPERIKDIFLRDTTNGKGYGIKNVDARIKLHFGNQYGIKIDSRPGIGTTVSIRIPRHRV